jgi:hypothetical protein
MNWRVALHTLLAVIEPSARKIPFHRPFPSLQAMGAHLTIENVSAGSFGVSQGVMPSHEAWLRQVKNASLPEISAT